MPAITHVPNGELRFVKRAAAPFSTTNAGHRLILQQRWVAFGVHWHDLDETNTEWRDVPLVEEE